MAPKRKAASADVSAATTTAKRGRKAAAAAAAADEAADAGSSGAAAADDDSKRAWKLTLFEPAAKPTAAAAAALADAGSGAGSDDRPVPAMAAAAAASSSSTAASKTQEAAGAAATAPATATVVADVDSDAPVRTADDLVRLMRIRYDDATKAALCDAKAWHAKLDAIARVLLTQCELRVRAGDGDPKTKQSPPHRFRLAEVEAYYHGPGHADTFAHRDALQLRTCGHWYFHRSGGTYKGGTYKGLDITIGAEGHAYGGFLLRGLVPLKATKGTKGDVDADAVKASPADLIEGPCRLVDTLLSLTCHGQTHDVAALADKQLRDTNALNTDNAVHLVVLPAPHTNAATALIRTPRVGLTLKKPSPDRLWYINADYRWLAAAAHIKKNKETQILALARAGRSVAQIATATGTKPDRVNQCVAWSRAGANRGATEAALTAAYSGKATVQASCEAYGVWSAYVATRPNPPPVADGTGGTAAAAAAVAAAGDDGADADDDADADAKPKTKGKGKGKGKDKTKAPAKSKKPAAAAAAADADADDE